MQGDLSALIERAQFTKGPWVIEPEYPSEVQTVDHKTIASCWHKYASDHSLPCYVCFDKPAVRTDTQTKFGGTFATTFQPCRVGV